MRRFLSVVTLALLAGCGPDSVREPLHRSQFKGSYTVDTVEHDGHKFIVYDGYECGGIIHHPGCPCLKAESR